MTLDQFITKWLGKKADFDGAYGGQCVDLARFYWKEVTCTPQPKGVNGAADFWTNYPTDPALNQNFDRIDNTPTGVPKNGDVMIWNKKAGGGFGHISMFISGDTNGFLSFDQNWPTLSVCTKTQHNYTNVLGWFSLKGTTMANMYKGYDLANPDSMRVAVDVLVRVQAGELVEKFKLDDAVARLAKANEDLFNTKNDLAKCNASIKPPEIGWEVNGKSVETTDGNTKTIINYKKV